VMSATFGLTGIGTIVAGALMPADGARWVWLAGGSLLAVAAAVGYALARDAMEAVTPAEAAAN
jgi:hypothetical protein